MTFLPKRSCLATPNSWPGLTHCFRLSGLRKKIHFSSPVTILLQNRSSKGFSRSCWQTWTRRPAYASVNSCRSCRGRLFTRPISFKCRWMVVFEWPVVADNSRVLECGSASSAASRSSSSSSAGRPGRGLSSRLMLPSLKRLNHEYAVSLWRTPAPSI